MAKFDLMGELVRSSGGAVSTTQGLVVDIDQQAIELLVAAATAVVIKNNLKAGNAPDGSASLPPLAQDTLKTRKSSAPRGTKTGNTIDSISARVESGQVIIAADEDRPGHLERILGGVALDAPLADRDVEAAIQKAVDGTLKTI